MIIELLGLPASGKTTIARGLEDECGYERSSKRPLSALDGVVGIVCFPALSFTILCALVANIGKGGGWYVAKNIALVRIAELGRLWRRERRADQVLDEGPLQALLSLQKKVSAHYVRGVLKHTPANVLLVVSVEEGERQERIASRTYKLRPHLSDVDRREWEEQVAASFETMKAVLESDARVRFIRTSFEAKEIVSELCKKQAHEKFG